MSTSDLREDKACFTLWCSDVIISAAVAHWFAVQNVMMISLRSPNPPATFRGNVERSGEAWCVSGTPESSELQDAALDRTDDAMKLTSSIGDAK